MSVAFTKNEDCAVASRDALAGFEREHGVTLPPEYRDFLLISRGGFPNPCWSAFGRDGDFVAYVYGMHQAAEWKRLSYAIQQFGHDLSVFLPVAVSNGGNYFLLRLIEPDRGAEAFRPPTFGAVIRVSDSFSSWLNSLREAP